MLAYYMFGIILLGFLGFGGFTASIYGLLVAGSDYEIIFLMAILMSCLFIGGAIYSIILFRRERAAEMVLRRERGEDVVKAKKKKEYSRLKKAAIAFVIIWLILMIPFTLWLTYEPDNSSDSSMIECGYCERDFSKSSSDGKSINKRGLCNNCYNNMKNTQDALEDSQKNN